MNKSISSKVRFKGRTAARLASVQALFQIEQSGEAVPSVISEFLTYRIKDKESGVVKFDTSFFTKLVEGAWQEHQQLDEMIREGLKSGWVLERIEPVTRAILRTSLYELLTTQTSSAIIIDEYINITHAFFDSTEASFVNGILNTLSKKIRPSA